MGQYSMYLFFSCSIKIEKIDILCIRPPLYLCIYLYPPKFDKFQPPGLFLGAQIFRYTVYNVPGTSLSSIFWASTLQKDASFQSKQESFGFQVYLEYGCFQK